MAFAISAAAFSAEYRLAVSRALRSAGRAGGLSAAEVAFLETVAADCSASAAAAAILARRDAPAPVAAPVARPVAFRPRPARFGVRLADGAVVRFHSAGGAFFALRRPGSAAVLAFRLDRSGAEVVLDGGALPLPVARPAASAPVAAPPAPAAAPLPAPVALAAPVPPPAPVAAPPAAPLPAPAAAAPVARPGRPAPVLVLTPPPALLVFPRAAPAAEPVAPSRVAPRGWRPLQIGFGF